MPKPFGVTDIWNNGEWNICGKCGREFKCRLGKGCHYWNDANKNLQCSCSDCEPQNKGEDCETAEIRIAKERVIFT